MEVDSLIVRRHKKKKLDRGVSNDSVKINGIKNATRSNTSKVTTTKDANEPTSNVKQSSR